MPEQPRAWVELDPDALINNLERVRQAGDAEILAVVKANAYGHGLEFVTTTLGPRVDAFAVAALDEALALRALFPKIAITLLSGFYHPTQIEVFKTQRIIPVVFNQSQISWLEAAGVRNLPVTLKLDTGMGRLGISPDTLAVSISRLQALGCKITLMSHFASADTPEELQNETQHQIFSEATSPYSFRRSFANSAAILTRPQDHYDMLRPGIMLYGSSPLKGISAESLGLKPVMRLYANLLDIKNLKRGDSVGYGATWVADKDCTIGVVSIGYGDGYPRLVADGIQLAVAGKCFPLVGRVSMDSLAFRLDDAKGVSIGDRVELWGEAISVDEVAQYAGTLAYELFCKLTSRVERRVI